MKYSDSQLMKMLNIDKKTLDMFKRVEKETLKEVSQLCSKKSSKIKVLGISGSVRSEYDMAQQSSNSEALLEISLNKLKELGAQVELVKLREQKIEPCKLCYSTVNTQCHHPCSCYPKDSATADDMSNTLYGKILEADAIIFATPVNNFSMSSPMKLFIDRCISLDGSLSPADPSDTKNRELNVKHMKYIELTSDDNTPGSGMLRRFTGKTAGIIVTGHEEGASLVISSLFMTLTHFGMIFPPFSNMYAMSSITKSTYEDKDIVLSDLYKIEAKMLAENVYTMAKLAKKTKMSDWKYEEKTN